MTQALPDHYVAVAYLRATLTLGELNERGQPEVSMQFGEHSLRLHLFPSPLSRLQANPPQGEQLLKIWPRLGRDGTLRPNPTLVSWHPVEDGDEVNTFFVLGRLGNVDKENAIVGIEILPNPNSNLKNPFYVNLVSSLELLNKLPPAGGGLRAWGEVKPKTLRFVMTKFQPVPLPPVGESVEERKARKKAITEQIAANTAAKKARLAQEAQGKTKGKAKGKGR